MYRFKVRRRSGGAGVCKIGCTALVWIGVVWLDANGWMGCRGERRRVWKKRGTRSYVIRVWMGTA